MKNKWNELKRKDSLNPILVAENTINPESEDIAYLLV